MSTELKNGTALSIPNGSSVVVGASAAGASAPGLWTFDQIVGYAQSALDFSAQVTAKLVATRGRVLTAKNATPKQSMSRTRHFARDALKSLQLVYGNWYVDPTSFAETNAGAAATVTASIEYPAGVFTQVKFSASATGNLTDGGALTSDSIAVNIPDGAEFFIRTFFQCTSGIITADVIDTAGGEAMASAASGLSDQTLSGTITDGATGAAYYPSAIIGSASKPSVAIYGDSRARGSSINSGSTRGNLEPSLATTCGEILVGVSGDQMQKFIASHAKRLAFANYCSDVVIQYGINDLSQGRTLAQLQADRDTVIGYFAGKEIWLATMEPVSTSTDSWATLTNQTPAAFNADRISYNSAIRAGITGVSGYFDISAVVESISSPGKWVANGTASFYTLDGVHCSANGELLVFDMGFVDTRQLRRVSDAPLRTATSTNVTDGVAHDLVVTPSSLTDVPRKSKANIFAARQTIITSDPIPFVISGGDPAQTAIQITHAVAAGLVGDIININFVHTSDNGTQYFGAVMQVVQAVAANASRAAQYAFYTTVAGSLALQVTFGDGFIVGSPTGSFKGSGSINTAAPHYENGAAHWTPIRKAADEARTSNATLANDGALIFPMAASKTYAFRAKIFYDTPAAADIKFRHTGPASPTLVNIKRSSIGPGASAASNVALDVAYSAADIVVTETSGTAGYFEIEGIIQNGSTAGNFALQWAQNTSTASPTTVRKGSFIEYAAV